MSTASDRDPTVDRPLQPSSASDYDADAAGAYEQWVEPLTGSFAATLFDSSSISLNGLKLLDAACGTGAVGLLAEARGALVTATDISPAMVARVAARSPTIATAVADIKSLPAHFSGRFDVVSSSFGVIFCGDVAAGLREMARCLRPGGVLVMSAWGNAAETEGFQLIPTAAAGCLPAELAARVKLIYPAPFSREMQTQGSGSSARRWHVPQSDDDHLWLCVQAP